MPRLAGRRLIFLDESGAHTGLARLYGRAPAGERVWGAVPQGDWQRTTMLSAIGTEGVVASLLFEGALDTAAFVTYVERVLAPQLRRGDLVVMDNLSVHKAAGALRAIERAGAQVQYLPPYSPDFNPIEKMWSKVKAALRRAAARTTDALYEAIAAALRAVTPADCQAFFDFCGYHATPNCKPP